MREGGRESLQKKTGEQIALECLAPGTSVRPGEGEVSTFWKLPWGCVNNSYIARSPRSFPGRVQGSYPS